MKRASAIGWGSAAVAFAAILIVLVDIIHTQSKSIDTGAPVIKTDQAARSAGAPVTPTDPKQVQ
jgi:hypothetical protein